MAEPDEDQEPTNAQVAKGCVSEGCGCVGCLPWLVVMAAAAVIAMVAG